MMPNELSTAEGFESIELRRKRLGQYFSGLSVAKLLVSLAGNERIKTVIDPMSGKGDMLVASKSILPAVSTLDGIEVDPLAHAQCSLALEKLIGIKSNCILGNAFDWHQLSNVCTDGYDLVVTNPPYVRYQNQSQSAGLNYKLPSASEVRVGLIDCIRRMPCLSEQDRKGFLALANGYSGLSDLAVPSWILCASLVKIGGTIAMVVPEAWLNRDYASVVQYLLTRWFRIEFIVEDASVSWFPGVQVKTTLVVAKRISMLTSVKEWSDDEYLHVELPRELATKDSLVGNVKYASNDQPELAFSNILSNILNRVANSSVPGLRLYKVKIADKASAAISRGQREKWFKKLEVVSADLNEKFFLPPVIASWFGHYRDFVTLSDLGVQVGQGLRTGANDFFYADLLKAGAESSEIRLSKLFQEKTLKVPNDCLRRVIRKQQDLTTNLSTHPSDLNGVALVFHGWAVLEHAEDAKAQVLPEPVGEHLRKAAKSSTGKSGSKLLPEMSAVAPNIRPANLKTGAPARYWYMLPDFAPRHRPDLLIARVNSGRPRVFLNHNRESLVDANFSSLWCTQGAKVTAYGMLAFLNSSIASLLFEFLGSVMGGGALKLESTHIRSMPIPSLTEGCWERLGNLGKKLATVDEDHGAILTQVDRIVCETVFASKIMTRKLTELHEAISQRQTARRKQNDASPRKSSTTVPK
ncbi:MAG: hypothetical protein Sw1PiTSA_26660 [Shewanella algae]